MELGDELIGQRNCPDMLWSFHGVQGDSNRSRCLSPEGSAARPASAGSRSSPAARSATKPVPATLDKQSSAAASYRTPERKVPADKAAAAAALPTPEKRASVDRPAGGIKATPSRGASVPLHADAATSGVCDSRACAGMMQCSDPATRSSQCASTTNISYLQSCSLIVRQASAQFRLHTDVGMLPSCCEEALQEDAG